MKEDQTSEQTDDRQTDNTWRVSVPDNNKQFTCSLFIFMIRSVRLGSSLYFLFLDGILVAEKLVFFIVHAYKIYIYIG